MFCLSLSSLQFLLTVSTLFGFSWSMPIDDNEINSSSQEYGKNGNFFEGDIILSSPSLNQRNVLSDLSMRWKSGIVPYEFNEAVNDEERKKILDAMEQFHKSTCVRFKERSEGDNDYVRIHTGDNGCSSYIGKIKGEQELHLDSNSCWYEIGTVMHELMHALGLFHEQSREDRDQYVDIFWDNIQKTGMDNFEKASPNTTVTFDLPYDYGSLMHYHSMAFSKNGEPTILPKDKTKKIGQRKEFSKYDITKINKMYNCTMANLRYI